MTRGQFGGEGSFRIVPVGSARFQNSGETPTVETYRDVAEGIGTSTIGLKNQRSAVQFCP